MPKDKLQTFAVLVHYLKQGALLQYSGRKHIVLFVVCMYISLYYQV